MAINLNLIEKILLVIIIFLLGFFVSTLVQNYGLEIEFPRGLFHSASISIPTDRINESDIEIYPDKIVIKIENPSISEYADTNSMLPIIDKGANGIRIQPKSEEDIKVGDIISFDSEYGLIVHRVVEIGEDEEGKYFITKGDNNLFSDGKVRFEQVKYITVGIIY
ncbi:MAG: signal peptidase I [Candidatus Pacearchaeota archaeon]